VNCINSSFPYFELVIEEIGYHSTYSLCSHEVHDLVESKFYDFEEYVKLIRKKLIFSSIDSKSSYQLKKLMEKMEKMN
jgi:hypothetical protein